MWTVEDRERYKDDGRRYPSDLTDAEWELVRSLFETYRTLTKDIRAMVDGCLYLGSRAAGGGRCPRTSGLGRQSAATGTASAATVSGRTSPPF
jgi:transposase